MRCDATSHTMTGFSSREVNVAIAVRSIRDVKGVPRRLAERACCTNSERTHYSYWNRQVSVGFCGTACDYVRKRCKLLQRRADDTHTHTLSFFRVKFSANRLRFGSRFSYPICASSCVGVSWYSLVLLVILRYLEYLSYARL